MEARARKQARTKLDTCVDATCRYPSAHIVAPSGTTRARATSACHGDERCTATPASRQHCWAKEAPPWHPPSSRDSDSLSYGLRPCTLRMYSQSWFVNLVMAEQHLVPAQPYFHSLVSRVHSFSSFGTSATQHSVIARIISSTPLPRRRATKSLLLSRKRVV